MLFRLILLFTLVPIIELGILIRVGARIGVFNTLLIVIATGVAGAALARFQGFRTLSRIRESLSMGELPAGPLLDGFLILAAGLLLLTPGLITDAVGFLILIPFTRARIRAWCAQQLRKMIERGNSRVIHFRSL